MSKFLRTIVILGAIFLFFCVGGYFLLNSAPRLFSQPLFQVTPTVPLTRQQNLVIIQVDDLTRPQPQLISASIGLFYISDPIQAKLVPLYPMDPLYNRQDEVAAAYGLTPDGAIRDDFWQVIKKYNLTINGFVLVDLSGSNTLLKWMTGSDQFTATPGDTLKTFEEQQVILSATCQQITRNTIQQSPAWSELITGHMRTDLGFEVMLSDWNILAQSINPPDCEIVVKN